MKTTEENSLYLLGKARGIDLPKKHIIDLHQFEDLSLSNRMNIIIRLKNRSVAIYRYDTIIYYFDSHGKAPNQNIIKKFSNEIVFNTYHFKHIEKTNYTLYCLMFLHAMKRKITYEDFIAYFQDKDDELNKNL